MESITIKVQERMLKEIESIIKKDYGTKTDFIREAIRDKIKEIGKEKALKMLAKNFGSSKKKVSDEELEKARHIVGKRFIKKVGFV